MARRATFSGGPGPESTDVVSQRTGASQLTDTKSVDSETAPDVARPSSTRTGPEFSFNEDEPMDARTREVVMVIGALLGQDFTSSTRARLMIMQLQNMGLYQESKALAEGFAKVRTPWMQGFMG